MKASGPYIDVGFSSIKALAQDRGVEIPLSRARNGRLEEESLTEARERLAAFFGPSATKLRRARCAVPAHGVSLRQLDVPAATRNDLLKTLSLQLETAFPLPPSELAWGFRRFGGSNAPSNGTGTLGAETNGAAIDLSPVVLVALRREILDQYDELLRSAGIEAEFSPAGIVSHSLCDVTGEGPSALLDIGRSHTELTLFEGDRPTAIRVLGWGGDSINEALSATLDLDLDEAEKLKVSWRGSLIPEAPSLAALSNEDRLAGVIAHATVPLVTFLRKNLPVHENGTVERPKLFITGGGARLGGLADLLVHELGNLRCEELKVPEIPGGSASTLAFQRAELAQEPDAHLAFLPPDDSASGAANQRTPVSLARWVAVAALLLAASLTLRYVPAIQGLRSLESEMAQDQAQLEMLPSKDRELSFLKFLKASRDEIRHLDIVTAVSRLAPPETLIKSIEIDPRGIVSITGTVANQRRANEFRRALLTCRLFSRVALPESATSGDRVRFRLESQVIAGAGLSSYKGPVAPPSGSGFAVVPEARKPEKKKEPGPEPKETKPVPKEEDKKNEAKVAKSDETKKKAEVTKAATEDVAPQDVILPRSNHQNVDEIIILDSSSIDVNTIEIDAEVLEQLNRSVRR
ncbi:MAG: cell division FtsA domain-containing protein [Planctomycetota bacterium]